jgi:hypothetical protein
LLGLVFDDPGQGPRYQLVMFFAIHDLHSMVR